MGIRTEDVAKLGISTWAAMR